MAVSQGWTRKGNQIQIGMSTLLQGHASIGTGINISKLFKSPLSSVKLICLDQFPTHLANRGNWFRPEDHKDKRVRPVGTLEAFTSLIDRPTWQVDKHSRNRMIGRTGVLTKDVN